MGVEMPHASWCVSELSATEGAELRAFGWGSGWVWTHLVLPICPVTGAAVSEETGEGMVREI